MNRTIDIHRTDGTIQNVEFSSTDYITKEVMQASEMTLNFSLPVYTEFELGCYVVFDNETYYLLDMSNPTKVNSENYTYSLKLQNVAGKFKNWIVQHPEDNRVKFSYTGKVIELLDMIVAICNNNIASTETQFERGDFIATEEDVVSFDCTNVFDALTSIADTFETEWYVRGNKISIAKDTNANSSVITLQYGKGYNVKPNIERKNSDRAVDRLFIQGSEQNILSKEVYGEDDGNYDSRYLHLPKNTTIYYDGTRFSSQAFDKARKYTTDANGLCVMSQFYETNAIHCDSALTLDTIYPKRVGTISNVTWSNGITGSTEYSSYDYDNNITKCNIYDNDIPDDMNSWDVMQGGTIHFQTGKLAGREFNITYYENREFFLTPHEEEDVTMPNDTFYPEVGDKYVALDIDLPQSYITSAENDLLCEAVRNLYDIETEQVAFTLPLLPMWFKANDITLDRGYNVYFLDSQLAPNGLTIRIQQMKQYLRDKYEMEITLANCKTKQRLKDDLNSLHIEAGISTETAVSETATSIAGSRGNQCYVGKPNPPYYAGDVYSIAEDDVIVEQYLCIRTRTWGNFNAKDWQEQHVKFNDLLNKPYINGNLLSSGYLQLATPDDVNERIDKINSSLSSIKNNFDLLSCKLLAFNEAIKTAKSSASLKDLITLDFESDCPTQSCPAEYISIDTAIPDIPIANTTEK